MVEGDVIVLDGDGNSDTEHDKAVAKIVSIANGQIALNSVCGTMPSAAKLVRHMVDAIKISAIDSNDNALDVCHGYINLSADSQHDESDY